MSGVLLFVSFILWLYWHLSFWNSLSDIFWTSLMKICKCWSMPCIKIPSSSSCSYKVIKIWGDKFDNFRKNFIFLVWQGSDEDYRIFKIQALNLRWLFWFLNLLCKKDMRTVGKFFLTDSDVISILLTSYFFRGLTINI